MDCFKSVGNGLFNRAALGFRQPANAPAPAPGGLAALDVKAQVIGNRQEGIDIGAVQPGAAEIDRHAIARRIGPGAPTDAVTRFDHLHGEATGHQGLGGGEPGSACADDDDVGIRHGISQTWHKHFA